MLASKAERLVRGGEVRLFTEEGRQSTKLKRLRSLRSNVALKKDAPSSYLHNSEKEALALQYVKDFQKQFLALQPKRKDLLLIASNEFEVPKFVSTTIRPTKLFTKDMYHYQEAADFVANLLEYEPLENAVRPSSCLPSPSQVLKWGTGDSFDFAVLLTSYLTGAGYNAYVVYGSAPAYITLKDLSHSECPAIGSGYEDCTSSSFNKPRSTPSSSSAAGRGGGANTADDRAQNKRSTSAAGDGNGSHNESTLHHDFEAKARPLIESKYLKDLEEARHRGPPPIDPYEDTNKNDPMDELDEVEKIDALKGRRVHAWVMIHSGKRDVMDPIFIEPTTGRVYPLWSSPYYSVEAVWNHRNYWVNTLPQTPLANLSFDLTETETWEYVFIDPFNQPPKAQTTEIVKEELDFDNQLGEQATGAIPEAHKMELEENILDIPTSWVSPLILSKDVLRLKYPPTGGRVTLYHKAKVELYADNVNVEGLVSRVSTYLDRSRTILKERREAFRNRADRLSLRIHSPLEHKVYEAFLPGRPGSLKEWTEWLGKRRVLRYHVDGRLDGLTEREEQLGSKIIERFEGRPDHLIVRTLHVVSNNLLVSKSPFILQDVGLANDMAVCKMSEKYSRNGLKKAHEDIAKRTSYVSEGRVRTVYQYDDPRVTRKATVVYKERIGPSAGGGGGALEAADDVIEYGDDALQQASQGEKECFTAIRHSQLEMAKLSERRAREEQSVKIERPIYDRVWEKSNNTGKSEDKTGLDDPVNERRVDHLTPFLANVKDAANMTKEEARHVRDNCLKALKERLMERANIIQTRLKDENAALSKLQANFQRSQQTSDEMLEEYSRQCSEAMFRIQILESRLNAHADAAVKKYEEMSDRLARDPRLLHVLR